MNKQTFDPTAQQNTLIQRAVSKNKPSVGHSIANADAGTGKTTTIELCIQGQLAAGYEGNEIVYVVHGKSNQLEANAKLGIKAVTVASMALSMCRLALRGAELDLDTSENDQRFKARTIARSVVGSEVKSPTVWMIIRITDLVKFAGINPTDKAGILEVIKHYSLEEKLADAGITIDNITDHLKLAYDWATIPGLWKNEAFNKKTFKKHFWLDFSELTWLIYLNKSWRSTPDLYSYIYVDEVQDNSNPSIDVVLRHARGYAPGPIDTLKERIAAMKAKMFLVGDEKQSIFGFSGAMPNSMDWLRSMFAAKEFPLTENFRCPTFVGGLVSSRIGYHGTKFPENTPEGQWDIILNSQVVGLAQPNNLVLSRTKAELYELAAALMAAGKIPEIVGMDLAKEIGSWCLRGEKHAEGSETWIEGTQRLLTERINKTTGVHQLDRLRSMKAIRAMFDYLVSQGVGLKYPKQFQTFVKTTLEGNTILLSTVHKAKGHEARVVFILSYNQFQSNPDKKAWGRLQRKWLEYVALTRATDTLYLCGKGKE